MKRANRLRAPSEFAHVYSTGRRIQGDGVAATIAFSQERAPRVAVTCARRFGTGVARNRAKRRLRAAIAPLIPRLRPGSETILQATPAVLSMSFQVLHWEIMEVLRKGQVLDA